MKVCLGALVVLVLASPAVAGDEPLRELPKLESGEWGYQEVVSVDAAEAPELQSRARAWIAAIYRSGKDVTQLDDPSGGTIVAKGNFGINLFLGVATINHALTLEFKHGRYRYQLAGFSAYGRPIDAWVHDAAPSEKGRAKVRSRIAVESQALIESLKAAMEKASPATSNW